MQTIDLKQLRKDLNLTQLDIADLFACNQNFISNIETGRKSVPADKINLLEQEFGDISKYIIEMPIVAKLKSSQPGRNTGSHCLIPFYDDVATVGGASDVIVNTDTQSSSVSEWINAGDWFPEATAAIRHYGDSMVEYPSGSILALKRVQDARLIINGRNYVIETTEFRITKQLQDDGNNYIMAYSSSTETYPDGRQIHSPIKIPKETIRYIDMVLGCVTKEYSNGSVIIKK